MPDTNQKQFKKVVDLLDVALSELVNYLTGKKGSLDRERWEARNIIIKAFSQSAK